MTLQLLTSEQEPEDGLVHLLYEKLAVRKSNTGLPVFIYLDKKCLNPGQNWETGFLKALQSCKVIILLMSSKVYHSCISIYQFLMR